MTHGDAPPRTGRGRDLAVAAGVFTTTLALRLTFLLRAQDTVWPHGVLYEGDAPVWVKWAATLSAGQTFEDDLPFRTPGVAFLLHWLGLVEPPFTAAKALWCILSAATPALLYLIAARRFGRTCAWVAAVLCVLSFGSFAISVSLNNEVPYALGVVAVLGLTLAWADTPRVRTAAALGVLHGACLLLRAEHVALLAMLCAWALAAAWRRGARAPRVAAQTTLIGAVAVLACLPWMLRSRAAVARFNAEAPAIAYERAMPRWTPGAIESFRALPGFVQAPNFAFLSDIARREGWSEVDEVAVQSFFADRWGSVPEPLAEWSLVSFKGPLDFALSNDLRGDGGFSRIALSDREASDPPFALARPSHAHLVNHGYAVGWASIRSDPTAWLRLVGEKLRRFADGVTLGLLPGDWPHGRTHARRAIDVATPTRGDAPLWNTTMLGLTGVGIALSFRRRDGGALLVVLGYRLLVVVAFYGYARHAVSIGPVLFLFVGLAVQWVVGWFARVKALHARASLARLTCVVAIAALVTVAARAVWNPPIWFAKGDRITPTPHWHPDAFEAVDAITLEPMPDSPR